MWAVPAVTIRKVLIFIIWMFRPVPDGVSGFELGFSIDPDEVDYDSVIQEFIDGKLVLRWLPTDIVGRIEEAKKNGEFPAEYGVTNIPNINEELEDAQSFRDQCGGGKRLQSQKKDIANEFAAYLTGSGAESV